MNQIFFLGVGLTLLLCGHSNVAALEGTPPQITEIQRRLRELYGSIKSFYAIYEISSSPDEDRPLGDLLHREVAMLAPAFVLHFNAHGNSRVHWSDDLRAQWAHVTPTTVTSNWIRNRTHSVWKWDSTKDSSLPGSLPQEWFFKATGLWPLEDRLAMKAENGIPFPLRLVAEDQRYSLADPPTEDVHGRLCHVICREGLDRIWLDLDRNCALVARELYEASTGKCLLRFEVTPQKQIVPGIWLPEQIRQIRFDPDRQVESTRFPLVDFECKVTNWRVNDLTEEEFLFHERPGEVWLNPPEKVPRQTQPGTEDYLDDVAAWIGRNGFAGKVKTEQVSLIDPFSVGAVALAGMIFWWTRSRKPTVPV